MSSPSNGREPAGMEPNPKRRDRKRRKSRRPGEVPDKSNREMQPGTPERFMATGNPGSGEEKEGSGYDTRNGQNQATRRRGQSEHVNAAHELRADAIATPTRHSGNHGRRKKKGQSDFAQLRNLRAVPVHTPAPTFHSVDGGEETPGEHKKSPRRNRNRKKFYAALDLGTNNCRLLVALPRERGSFKVVDGFSRIVRLGEGLAQNGYLQEEAMDRAIDALKICSGKLRNGGIRRQRLIATEACRRADNGLEFLQRVKRETGLRLEIVDRETEARLAAEGCGSLLDRKADGAVLFDIGGGSSEVILVENSKPKKPMISERIMAWTSLPLGVVTLAEQFGGRDVSRALFGDMVSHVKEQIGSFQQARPFEQIMRNGRVHLLGTSGTVTTLAGIHLNLTRYDRKKVDGIWLKAQDIDAVINQLLSMSYEQRAQNPCIGRERADLVLAGCAIWKPFGKFGQVSAFVLRTGVCGKDCWRK